MLALEIEYLTGRCYATAYNDRRRSEWPPHPARLFSALTEACFVGGVDGVPEEVAALEWLEEQDPPHIQASPASSREVVTVFVPVNDATVLGSFEDEQAEVDRLRALADGDGGGTGKGSETREKRALAKAEDRLSKALAKAIVRKAGAAAGAIRDAHSLLPEGRVRQPRTFPSVTPESSRVHFVWPGAEPTPAVREALARLASRLVNLGHSASLVRAAVVDHPPTPNWVPDPDGPVQLRIVRGGQLRRLQDEFHLHRATEPRVLPCAFQPYRTGEAMAPARTPRSVFGWDWVVLGREGGDRLPITAAAGVAQALRGALIKYADEPLNEALSGHRGDGAPSEVPHVAFVPLPRVGDRFADGAILGAAIVVPRDIAAADRRHLLRALGRWEAAMQARPGEPATLTLTLGRAGVMHLRREVEYDRAATLNPGTWSTGARVWVSATPVALDRNPGDLRSRDAAAARRAHEEAAAALRLACQRIGLPEPDQVDIHPSVPLVGTEKAVRFSPFPAAPGRVRRVLVHARLEFDEPVAGPILLGAGRYFGMGLFRPIRDEARGEA